MTDLADCETCSVRTGITTIPTSNRRRIPFSNTRHLTVRFSLSEMNDSDKQQVQDFLNRVYHQLNEFEQRTVVSHLKIFVNLAENFSEPSHYCMDILRVRYLYSKLQLDDEFLLLVEKHLDDARHDLAKTFRSWVRENDAHPVSEVQMPVTWDSITNANSNNETNDRLTERMLTSTNTDTNNANKPNTPIGESMSATSTIALDATMSSRDANNSNTSSASTPSGESMAISENNNSSNEIDASSPNAENMSL